MCKQICGALALVLATCLLLALPAAAGSTEIPGTKSGFITTPDGVRIHYLEAGTQRQTVTVGLHHGRDKKGNLKLTDVDYKEEGDPTILFVPGWTMPGWIWEHQIAHFSKTHRVVAMDPRSQGESSKPAEGHYSAARARDIKAVVDELKLKPVVLVGWSMGVMEIAAYVDQFGTADLAGMVLVDGIAGADFDPQTSPQFLQWAGSFLFDRPKATATFVRSMYRQPQSEDYLERVIAASLKTPTNSAGALLLAYVASDYRPALAKFDKPTLVIAARSPWLPQFEKVSLLVPGSRLVVVDDASHALFVDKPVEFNAALDDFLKPLGMTTKVQPW
ncbi:MAG: alpha/beta fold hydrolase [Candidatus Acidiferrales bacterium]